jgi:S-(hydroxymethyl)glutathione dehydrogenase / alcohol dehydrogenase
VETKGALLWGVDQKWSVEPISIPDPLPPEAVVKVTACGLCHTDEHLVTGDITVPHWPMLGGHEAAGEIVAIGSAVPGFSVGDHVVLSAIPGCGRCRPCLLGYGAVCDEAYRTISGESIADNRRRIRARGDQEVSALCHVGGLAPYITVHEYSLVKVHKSMPLELASLLGCGVSTGWGAVVNVAQVRPGDTAVVMGLGGIGAASVLACVASGAERVVVVDPAENKRGWALELGATHFFPSNAEATQALRDDTWGLMADKVMITVGRMEGHLLQEALELTGKLGVVAAVSAGDFTAVDVKLNINEMRGYLRSIRGVIQNGGSPKVEISKLINLYAAGKLPLEKLVTARYRLEEVNQGYRDMLDARNIRGIVVFDDADY